MHLYNTDSDSDATGDWTLSLTAVSQQGGDAKARSRSMNLQDSLILSDITKSNVSKNVKAFKSI